MQTSSPVKIVAGLAAVLLAVVGVILAAKLHRGAEEMFSGMRLHSKSASAPAARPADAGATPSGVKVIPIGVADKPASANAGGPGGR
ncbi:hypothetical protein [Roseateles sp.]|jgi:hypothetical protein|uniref:hypothetical protein n=1 Tax=Roseateles sp. TaxID=1971397 RepID=UPI0031D9DB67